MDEFSASARMNHYEIGRHTPDYSTLNRIAAVLGLPVAYFYANSDELAILIKEFGGLTEADRATVLKLVNSLSNSQNLDYDMQ